MKIKKPTPADYLTDSIHNLLNKQLNFDNKHIENLLTTGLVPLEINDNFNDDRRKQDFSLMMFRAKYIEQFGFTTLSQNLINKVSQLFKNDKIIEVGAGSGWLSYNLQQKGLDVTAVDLKPLNNEYGFKHSYTDVIEANAQDYITQHQYDTIIMSWPDYDGDFAANILALMHKGKTLIYIGEREGGCTANDDFFHLLEQKCTLNEVFTQQIQPLSRSWPGIHDKWYVYNT